MVLRLLHHFLPVPFLFGAIVMGTAVLLLQSRFDRQRGAGALMFAIVMLLVVLAVLYGRCDIDNGGCT